VHLLRRPVGAKTPPARKRPDDDARIVTTLRSDPGVPLFSRRPWLASDPVSPRCPLGMISAVPSLGQRRRPRPWQTRRSRPAHHDSGGHRLNKGGNGARTA
jgi:hypothetical protein